MSSTNTVRNSPRVAAMRNRASVASRIPMSGVRTSTRTPTSGVMLRPRARASAVVAHETTAGSSGHAARASASNVVPRAIASRTRAGTVSTRTATVRTIASATRGTTQPPASNHQEKALLEVPANVVSPFSNSTNLDDTRVSAFCITVIYCPICLANIKEENKRTLVTSCGHLFCELCLKQAYNLRKVCPMCQQRMKIEDSHEVFY